MDTRRGVVVAIALARDTQRVSGPEHARLALFARKGHATVVAKDHYSYRGLLGELIYAYVICRVDIGDAICFLARFSDAPHEEHYKGLKSVCRYCRATKDWGIVFQRPKPLADLPDVPFP